MPLYIPSIKIRWIIFLWAISSFELCLKIEDFACKAFCDNSNDSMAGLLQRKCVLSSLKKPHQNERD